MQPEFSRAAVASFIASIVRGVTTFAEEIERTGREPTQPPPEAQPRASPLAVTMLSQVLDADLDQWETNVLSTAPPRPHGRRCPPRSRGTDSRESGCRSDRTTSGRHGSFGLPHQSAYLAVVEMDLVVAVNLFGNRDYGLRGPLLFRNENQYLESRLQLIAR